MKIKINVTQNDIKKGERKITYACPIALALIRRGFKQPHVTCYEIRGALAGSSTFAFPPERVKQFMKAFDAKKKVKPTSFTLDFK